MLAVLTLKRRRHLQYLTEGAAAAKLFGESYPDVSLQGHY